MRRVTALCAAVGIAASALVVAAPAQAGYYVIRWENTGICQIWNEDLKSKPMEWFSHYKQVSKPVPTFDAALAVKSGLMKRGVCKL